MSRLMQRYIASIDRVNLRIGRIVMHGIFVLIGILLWSSISKIFFLPSLWTLEMAQFSMVAYYILGGPYSLQMGSNVRMDLFYGTWSLRKKPWFERRKAKPNVALLISLRNTMPIWLKRVVLTATAIRSQRGSNALPPTLNERHLYARTIYL